MPSISCPHIQSLPPQLLNSIPVRQSVFTELLSAWSWSNTNECDEEKQIRDLSLFVLLRHNAGFLVHLAPDEMHCWQKTQPTSTLLSRHKIKSPNTTLTFGAVQSSFHPTLLQVQQLPASIHFLHLHVFCFICLDWEHKIKGRDGSECGLLCSVVLQKL